jgi:uracil-DNA glycosylase
MIAAEATAPRKPQQREQPMARKSSSHDSLSSLREEAAECRVCYLWKDATQTVFDERELAAINPALVVRWARPRRKAVFGKITPINKSRGRLIDMADGRKALVTVHPSYLLRLPDQDARAREYERFVDDLKIAATQLQRDKAP